MAYTVATEMEAKDLMARYCDGDASAFRELYTLVSPRLYGYLVKLCRHRALASDLLQQSFMKVHRARAAYIRGADPVPWIYAIAHRTFIDEFRRQRRDTTRLAELRDLEASPRDGAHDDGSDDRVNDALVALARLPHDQRQAVVLTKLEGKSLLEAAEIAGTSVTAMKVRAHRGYKALRGHLAQSPERPT